MSRVLVYADDLMFVSRIREAAKGAGVEIDVVRRPEGLPEALAARPRTVLVDLDAVRLDPVASVASQRGLWGESQVVGFFSHVHVDRSAAAKSAGFHRVMPRSQFVKDLPALLAEPGGTLDGPAGT